MKIKIVLVVAVFFVANSYAQISKGNWLVGGNGEFQRQKTTYSTTEISSTQLSISPKIGHFILDRFAIGLYTNYSRTVSKSNINRSRYSIFGVGPFLRYYLLNIEKNANINLIVEGNGAYNVHTNNSISVKSDYLSYSILTGPVIFFNSSVGIEFLFGYKGISELKNDTRSSGIHFNIGLQVALEREK
ncbi:hypothetical protein [Phnomibacter sp. MR]|uniref:hypothetical protein n=1 Tax=Phnomibacter sp. MR TaxID=3042318 RepID=UPI003A807DAA